MKKWKLLLIPIVIIVGVGTAFFFFSREGKSCRNCNLVVFDADILRADVIDCENHPEITPNLCEVQDEFIKFNNHHSQSDLTRPSMTSFLTSSYPTTHGVWNELFYQDVSQPSLINLLKKKNYSTHIVGGGGNVNVIYRGYDEKLLLFDEEKVLSFFKKKPSFTLLYRGDPHFPYLSHDSSVFIKHPKKPDNFFNNRIEFEKEAGETIVNSHSYLLERPVIKEFIESQNGSTRDIYPFFLEICSDKNVKEKLISVDACWVVSEETLYRYIDKHDSDHVEFIKFLYLEQVKVVDEAIGNAINLLKMADLWGETVFAIRSDHGEEFMEHGNLGHSNNLYQELLRVPFWVHVPGQKGKIVGHLTQTIDETPTLLSALGIEPHPLMQGRNLLDPIVYKNQVDFAIAQKLFDPMIFSVREGDFKLISVDDSESGDASYELYNLREDPDEKNNIAEENQEIVEELLSKYYNTVNQQSRFKSSNQFFEQLTDQQKNNMYEDGYF